MDVFDAIIIVALSASVMALFVKIYEWRQDVLYGPYIQPADKIDAH